MVCEGVEPPRRTDEVRYLRHKKSRVVEPKPRALHRKDTNNNNSFLDRIIETRMENTRANLYVGTYILKSFMRGAHEYRYRGGVIVLRLRARLNDLK